MILFPRWYSFLGLLKRIFLQSFTTTIKTSTSLDFLPPCLSPYFLPSLLSCLPFYFPAFLSSFSFLSLFFLLFFFFKHLLFTYNLQDIMLDAGSEKVNKSWSCNICYDRYYNRQVQNNQWHNRSINKVNTIEAQGMVKQMFLRPGI